jgi:rhodanese-related sulfurtransferase
VIIAAPSRENESAVRLGRIGFDNVAGYLQKGLQSLESRPDLVVFIERLSPQFAAELIASNQPPLAVDVRAPREREQKHLGGSLSMPLNHLAQSLKALPKNRALVVYCAGGYRSSIAASLLKASGFDSVCEIAGGLVAWESANLPVQTVQT